MVFSTRAHNFFLDDNFMGTAMKLRKNQRKTPSDNLNSYPIQSYRKNYKLFKIPLMLLLTHCTELLAQLMYLPSMFGCHMAQKVALLLSTIWTVLTIEPRFLTTLHAPMATQALSILVHAATTVTSKRTASTPHSTNCNIVTE